MIISKTPLRISFCGGGSDIPSFYRKHGGCVLSTSIDKYIYITSSRSFERGLTKLRYSSMECVHELSDIKHPVFREMLTRFGMPGYEFTSTSDIPAGTGLGSSSTFTVGLSNVLRTRNGETASKETLAQDACRFEIDILREPIGKQDQRIPRAGLKGDALGVEVLHNAKRYGTRMHTEEFPVPFDI